MNDSGQKNPDLGLVRVCMIGGTGRSGTSIMKRILARHPEVAATPVEHHFIVDPDGLVDFYTSLFDTFSPWWFDVKVRRLERLLHRVSRTPGIEAWASRVIRGINRLSGRRTVMSPPSYAALEIGKFIPTFPRLVDELIAELESPSFRGAWDGTSSYSVLPQARVANQQALTNLAGVFGKFLRQVTREYLERANRLVQVDDTPWNLLFARQILAFLPECKFIHTYRDPRDVVASFSHQRWAPTNKKQAALWYRSLVEEWFRAREHLPADSFMECSLEDLVADPESVLRRVCCFLSVPWDPGLLEIDLSRHNIGRWKKDYSTDEIKEVDDVLSDILPRLGYQ